MRRIIIGLAIAVAVTAAAYATVYSPECRNSLTHAGEACR